MRKALLAGVALVAASVPALANPTNFYAGVSGGYRMSDFDVRIPAYALPAGDFGLQPNGFQWGVFGAMTYDLGDMVEIGLQLEGNDFAGNANNPTGGAGGETLFVTENYNASLSFLTMIKVDAGTKVFASVGYGLSQADFSLSNLAGVSRTGDFKGLVAGVGFTRDISNGLFFRAQYRYSDLGSDVITFAGPFLIESAESHDFSAGIGLTF